MLEVVDAFYMSQRGERFEEWNEGEGGEEEVSFASVIIRKKKKEELLEIGVIGVDDMPMVIGVEDYLSIMGSTDRSIMELLAMEGAIAGPAGLHK